MYRWDIINALIEKNNYKSYLEIGYYKGWSFDQVRCQLKRAVDPNPSKTPEQELMKYGDVSVAHTEVSSMIVKQTSDDFFKGADQWEGALGTGKWDIIFIDGLHEAGQVYRDIQNSLTHLAPGGTIVMHDCNPPKYEHTTTGIDGCWTGDTYKAILQMQDKISNINFYTVDTDWGVGILRPMEGVHFIQMADTKKGREDWEYFDKYRTQLLSLITVEEFKEKYL